MYDFLSRDYKRRHLFRIKELQYRQYRMLLANRVLPMEIRQIIFFKFLKKYSSLMSKGRMKNSCLHSKRLRSVYSKFGLNRISLRSFYSFGFLNGLRRSSW